MRLLNDSTGEALTSVTVYLTPAEARELLGSLEQLLATPKDHHHHVNDQEYEHELTVTIYWDDNIDTFDERSRRLILDNE